MYITNCNKLTINLIYINFRIIYIICKNAHTSKYVINKHKK